MALTDAQLEAIAADFEAGWDDERLDQARFNPGPYAWLLDVVGDDWEAFTTQLQTEQTTPTELISRVLRDYLHQQRQTA